MQNFLMSEKVITKAELGKHSTENSLWIMVDGIVYDVTNFQEEHPGGGEVLLDNGGKDSSSAFHLAAHTPGAVKSMVEFRIGVIEGYDPAKYQKDSSSGGVQQGGALMIVASLIVIALSAALSWYLKSLN